AVNTGAILLSTAYSAERSKPEVLFVEAETINRIDAPGATAPAHSVSMTASFSKACGSLLTPGLRPLTTICGSFEGSPNTCLKFRTSLTLILLAARIAMVVRYRQVRRPTAAAHYKSLQSRRERRHNTTCSFGRPIGRNWEESPEVSSESCAA